jgi:methylglutaconyl-CoA hydratase
MATGYEHLELHEEAGVLRVWLNRPEVRNAFNDKLIAELAQAFTSVGDGIRAAVLGGQGNVFCAGADLDYMKRIGAMSHQENMRDALALADMLAAVNACPVPLVGRCQKAAFGGAIGLLACCDTVIATGDAVFAFSEVRLGISPATIAPYVLAKIGETHARDLFLSGERWDAPRALAAGLVHRVVPLEELDAAVDAKLTELLQAGPQAARATKKLIREVRGEVPPALRESTARLIADLRGSDEGREGLSAFLEKRRASWMIPDGH